MLLLLNFCRLQTLELSLIAVHIVILVKCGKILPFNELLSDYGKQVVLVLYVCSYTGGGRFKFSRSMSRIKLSVVVR